MTHRNSAFLLLSLGTALSLGVLAVGCVDLDPLDPDKPLPGTPPTNGQPPPSCGLGTLDQGDAALYLHVIDVGQGDALLLQTPDDGIDGNGTAEGLNILIDAGNNGYYDLTDGGHFVNSFLHRLGVQKLDYAIVTHAHADHYGGMVTVFDEFPVVNIVDPGYNSPNTTWTGFTVAAEAEARATGGRFYRPAIGDWVAQPGDTVDWGSELTVRVMWASDVANLGQSDNSQVNNTSIVLRVSYGDINLMLMGDGEQEVEGRLLDSGLDLATNILKVGHHGSNSSSSTAFIEALFKDTPEDLRFAAISSGRVSFGGVQLPTLQTKDRIRHALDTTHLFSTEYADSDKTETNAPGDDDITFVVTPDGQVGACYIY